MRCKACNNALKNVRDRNVEGVSMIEDLCPKCLELAMSAVFGKDLDDDALYAIEILGVDYDDLEITTI